MNKYYIAIWLTLMCCLHQSLRAQKKIVIDKFEPKTFTAFQTGETIQEENAAEGLNISVLKDLNLKSLEVKKANGQFEELTVVDEVSNLKNYKLPVMEDVSTIELKMSRTENGKLVEHPIKITVAKDEGVTIVKKNCDDKISLKPAGDCKPLTVENNFGEDVVTYSDNTVVYVYDFNPDPSKRTIYKFVKSGAGLTRTAANMSTEVLKPKQQVYFKVVNINRYLYDVTLADTMLTFFSEPSALFNRLFLGDSALLGGLLTTFSTNNAAAQSSKSTQKNLSNLAANIRCFFTKYNRLQDDMLEAYNPCADFSCCLAKAEVYYKLANDLLDIKLEMAVVFQNLVKQQQQDLEKKRNQLSTCEAAREKLEANTKALKELEALGDKATKEDKEKIAALQKEKPNLEKAAQKCTDADMKKLNSDIAALEETTKYYAAINDLQTKMLPSETDLRKLMVFLKNMVRQQNVFVSGPLTLKGNRLDLTLRIQSRDSITKHFSLNPFAQTLSYQLPVKAKAFVTFSTGSFIGVSSRLKNTRYEWQQVPSQNNTVVSTDKYQLVESGYSSPAIGFAALGNVQWGLGQNVALGFSTGVGITIERDPRPAYLLGGSLCVGDLRQFVLTGGIAVMAIDRLSNNLQLVAEQGILYTEKPAVDYYKEAKVGPFISITYTPFTIHKNK